MSGGAFKLGKSTELVYLIAVHLVKDPVDLPSRSKVLGWRLAELDLFYDSSKPASVQKDKRRPTLADLSLSPLVFYLWLIVARIYVFMESYLWPVIHSITVACIHIFIQCLPALTKMLHFDLESMPSLT